MNQQSNPAYYTEDGLARTIREAASDPEFPQYGYGVVQAAALAGALELPSMSALELGVAGGNGLVALEELSDAHSKPSGVEIAVSGFDLGGGMPPPNDYRDLPYIWREGFFRMDEARLRARLKSADLYIGDITDRAADFKSSNPSPIGFISFDLDYYSATVKAFDALLQCSPEHYLPRVVCYFDDTVGPHHEMHSQFTGELLAIQEFNQASRYRKLDKLNGLRHKVAPIDGPWLEGIFILHLFDHPLYDQYIFPERDRQFPLTR